MTCPIARAPPDKRKTLRKLHPANFKSTIVDDVTARLDPTESSRLRSCLGVKLMVKQDGLATSSINVTLMLLPLWRAWTQ